MGVIDAGGRLGSTDRDERWPCENRRTLPRDHLPAHVFEGLKPRPLAPEPVAEFMQACVSEVTAANRRRGRNQARIAHAGAKFERQLAICWR